MNGAMTPEEERTVFLAARKAGYFNGITSKRQARMLVESLLGEKLKHHKVELFDYFENTCLVYLVAKDTDAISPSFSEMFALPAFLDKI